MRKDMMAYGGLLVVGLGMAYYASLPRSDASGAGKEWFNVGAKDIASISYDSPDAAVKVEPLTAGNGFKIHYEAKTKPNPAEQAPPAKKAVTFKGNERMTALVDWLAPLRALRVVGAFDEAKKAEFGLDEKAGHFRLATKAGEALSLVIGKRSYGSANVFALDEAKKKVILIKGTPLEDLERADSRMFERKTTNLPLADVEKATIKAGAKEVVWNHTERDQNGALQWKDDRPDAKPKASYKTWMEKILDLGVERYADDAEVESLKAEPAFLSVTFSGGGDTLEVIELKKLAPGKSSQESDPAPTYWLKSIFLGTYARINANQADVVESEIPDIIRGQ